mmetsp:Transcript_70713/g.153564  ORF Transcript_70713/g.153564 Transcript_70713/m.153564 type:complete len:357 (-) Transcript_70713:141-1211(-)
MSNGSAPKEIITLGIIGCGRAGHFHMSNVGGIKGLRLKWVVDADLARAKQSAQDMNCNFAESTEPVLKDPEVDAVIVSSVTNTHYNFCKLALQAGKAVLTEKPISHDPAELKEIISLAEKTGKAFVVGYQRRTDKNFRELKRQIDAGAIGDLRLLKHCSRDNPLPPLEYLKVSGGIFYDMLCHDFDLIHYFCEQFPVEVVAMGHCYDKDIAGFDDLDTVVVTMKFESGLMAMVDCSRTAPYGYDQRVEAVGCEGMCSVNNESQNSVVLADKHGYRHAVDCHSFPQRYYTTYKEELAEFVELVRHGRVEPPEIMHRHIELERLTAASELSWRLKRAVRLTEVDGLREHLPHGANAKH